MESESAKKYSYFEAAMRGVCYAGIAAAALMFTALPSQAKEKYHRHHHHYRYAQNVRPANKAQLLQTAKPDVKLAVRQIGPNRFTVVSASALNSAHINNTDAHPASFDVLPSGEFGGSGAVRGDNEVTAKFSASFDNVETVEPKVEIYDIKFKKGVHATPAKIEAERTKMEQSVADDLKTLAGVSIVKAANDTARAEAQKIAATQTAQTLAQAPVTTAAPVVAAPVVVAPPAAKPLPPATAQVKAPPPSTAQVVVPATPKPAPPATAQAQTPPASTAQVVVPPAAKPAPPAVAATAPAKSQARAPATTTAPTASTRVPDATMARELERLGQQRYHQMMEAKRLGEPNPPADPAFTPQPAAAGSVTLMPPAKPVPFPFVIKRDAATGTFEMAPPGVGPIQPFGEDAKQIFGPGFSSNTKAPTAAATTVVAEHVATNSFQTELSKSVAYVNLGLELDDYVAEQNQQHWEEGQKNLVTVANKIFAQIPSLSESAMPESINALAFDRFSGFDDLQTAQTVTEQKKPKLTVEKLSEYAKKITTRLMSGPLAQSINTGLLPKAVQPILYHPSDVQQPAMRELPGSRTTLTGAEREKASFASTDSNADLPVFMTEQEQRDADICAKFADHEIYKVRHPLADAADRKVFDKDATALAEDCKAAFAKKHHGNPAIQQAATPAKNRTVVASRYPGHPYYAHRHRYAMHPHRARYARYARYQAPQYNYGGGNY